MKSWRWHSVAWYVIVSRNAGRLRPRRYGCGANVCLDSRLKASIEAHVHRWSLWIECGRRHQLTI